MPVTLGSLTSAARDQVGPDAPDVVMLRDTGSAYRDGSELRVLDILRRSADVSSLSDEPLSHAQTWPERYHLSAVRSNIVRPLEISATDRVLEIGAGCGAVTRYLGEVAGLVDAVEPVAARADCIAERTRDLDTVQVFIGEVTDLPAVPTYDVVVVIGVLEYVGAGTADLSPYRDFLAAIAERLVDGGSLVLAIENKLGVKYLAGAPEDHSNRAFDSVEGYPLGAPARTFDRASLTTLLVEAGLQSDTAIAFPDYKLPRVVFRPDLLTAQTQSLLFRVPAFPSPDRLLPRAAMVDEGLLWRSFVDAGLAADTGNSLVMLAGKGGSNGLWPRGIGGTYYSAGRRGEYVTESRIDVTGPPLIRRRRLAADQADAALRLVVGDQPYVPGTDLLELVVDTDDRNTRGFLTQWVELVTAATASMAGHPPLDLVPHNLVVGADGRLHFIDDEWRADVATRESVLRRGALYVGIKLAEAAYVRGTWSGCTTFADATRAVGAVIGLDASGEWMAVAIAEEAALQVTVTTWHGGDPGVVSAALTSILERQLRPEPEPQHAERLAALEAELAEFHSLDLTQERLNRLAMADELIGLRAELAQVRVHTEAAITAAQVEANQLRQLLDVTLVDLAEARELAGQAGDRSLRAQDETSQVIADRDAIKASVTWRIGRTAMAPVRAAKRVARRLVRR